MATRNHGLDALRVAAILGVVAIHVFGLMVGNDDLRGTLPWWIATAIDMGAVWCVPVFIMISGALVLAPGRTPPDRPTSTASGSPGSCRRWCSGTWSTWCWCA
ncbi:acyltransferase family protein [Catellatospora coxensis]